MFRTLVTCLSLLLILGICEGAQRPIVIGHRGSAYLPELTLASQALAHAYGADMIEIDVCLSRDNQLIVIHDLYLNAVSNVADLFPNRNRSDGFHYVIDFDLAELRRLTIHERVQPFTNIQVYPSRFPASANVPFQLATLNETLELLLGLNRATGRRCELLLEIKEPEYYSQNNRSISSVVLATLDAYNLTQPSDPIVIQTFHIEELIHIRQNLSSQLRLCALLTWNSVNASSSDYDFYASEAGLQALSKIVQAIAPDMGQLVDFDKNDSIIGVTNLTSMAHKYNLPVYPYTFRQDTYKGNFEQLIKFFHFTVGVDGFITSQPNVVIELLQRDVSTTSFSTISMNSSTTTLRSTSTSTGHSLFISSCLLASVIGLMYISVTL